MAIVVSVAADGGHGGHGGGYGHGGHGHGGGYGHDGHGHGGGYGHGGHHHVSSNTLLFWPSKLFNALNISRLVLIKRSKSKCKFCRNLQSMTSNMASRTTTKDSISGMRRAGMATRQRVRLRALTNELYPQVCCKLS